jgi:hypothetical protein
LHSLEKRDQIPFNPPGLLDERIKPLQIDGVLFDRAGSFVCDSFDSHIIFDRAPGDDNVIIGEEVPDFNIGSLTKTGGAVSGRTPFILGPRQEIRPDLESDRQPLAKIRISGMRLSLRRLYFCSRKTNCIFIA